MLTGFFAIFLQVAVGVFIIWGLFHEDKLVRCEDRIAAAFRRRFAHKAVRRPAAQRRPAAGRSPARQNVRPAVRVRPVRSSRCA